MASRNMDGRKRSTRSDCRTCGIRRLRPSTASSFRRANRSSRSTCPMPDDFARFYERYTRIQLAICYCSALDECWMYDERETSAEARRHPVAACPARGADEFNDSRLAARHALECDPAPPRRWREARRASGCRIVGRRVWKESGLVPETGESPFGQTPPARACAGVRADAGAPRVAPMPIIASGAFHFDNGGIRAKRTGDPAKPVKWPDHNECMTGASR